MGFHTLFQEAGDREQAKHHVSAALQMLRIACDYLDDGRLEVGRDIAKDARLELYLAYKAMGGYGHLDAAPGEVTG